MKKINIEGLNEVIYKGTCDNGLDVYVWTNEHVKTTFMTLSVKYGSIDTEFSINGKNYSVPSGVAHFLEHIKFNEKNGTAHEYFSKNGADTNAFTTFRYTSYLVYTVNNIEENLVHLLDFVQTPYFNKKMIQKEKGIILEEANMGLDSTGNVAYYGLLNALFKNSNYRNYIAGSKDDIKSISYDDIKLVYDTFYTPDNMFLCVTGNVNPYEIFEIVKNNQKSKKFKKVKNFEKKIINEPAKVNQKYVENESLVVNPFGYYALKISKRNFKGYHEYDLKKYLKYILSINFGQDSDFYENIINNKIATDLSFGVNIIDGYIIIYISFESKYYDETIKRIDEKMNSLVFDEASFKRKLKGTIASLILSFEDVENVNSNIQDFIIKYDELLPDIKLRMENYTFNDLEKIASKITTNNKSVYIMVPKK